MARVSKRKNRRKPRLRVEKEARRRARQGVGPPPPGRVITDKRLKPPKYKKELIEEEIE
jgi:hypothetical protein